MGRGGSRGRGERWAVWRCGAEREGRCAARGKRSTVRGPMQRAAMACAVRCDGLCTALHRLSRDAA